MQIPDLETPTTARLDIWMWRARFFKTRTKARLFIRLGRVRIERDGQTLRMTKSHFGLMPTDRMTFVKGGRLFHIEVIALGQRRGPAREAQTLYRDLSTATKLTA